MTLKPNAPIWHYFDLAKYIGLLSQGLFFSLPSALRASDPWEGCSGQIDFSESLDSTVHAGPEGVAQWKEALRIRYHEQDGFGISCWNESSTESAALWQLYASRGLGVAVRSTPEKLEASLGNRTVEVKPIDYDGHHGRQLGKNPLVLLSTKRPEFRHEAEVRFFTRLTDDEKTVLTSFYATLPDRTYRQVKPGSKGVVVQTLGGFVTTDPTCLDRGAPAGVHLPTDVATLIDRIVLSPNCAYSLRRAVRDVTQKFGFSKKLIAEADFDFPPYDRVKFVD